MARQQRQKSAELNVVNSALELPKILVDFASEGQVILFLGAGASLGARGPDGKFPPTGDGLKALISERFLGGEFVDRPLAQISELAASETDLFTVQQFVASEFKDFSPADSHKLIPRFYWRAIATTNFDLVVERAYEEVADSLQTLVPFRKNGEWVEEKLRAANSLVYLKLHGCITDINDPNSPLILTPDQYITHRRGRSRLFERLHQFAFEYPIVFIGHSLGDPDIRGILLELSELEGAKPRSYIVTPNMSPPEVRFWEGRRISPIQASFEEFITELDRMIPVAERKIPSITEQPREPIYERFRVPEEVMPTIRLKTFLTRDVEYVHKSIKPSDIDPQAFYKGYFLDWTPIINDLDVPRSISDDIISEVLLSNEEEKTDRQELYVVKGHAGAGKSVIIRRLAWDASVLYDRLCLRLRRTSFLELEPLLELSRLSQERLFLFVDPVSEFSDAIETLIRRAKKDDIALTIIGAERNNEWNISCQNLDPYLNDDYELRYLSEHEIDRLLDLLETHRSLGYLEELTQEERHEALAKRAGRQLLVALHEATMGKPFEEIVFDEYRSIPSPQSKSLYLTVCVSYMLGVPVRAGLISRVHGIPFSLFREKLFKPLEFIVFASKNSIIQDYEYRARHPHIAEMVVEKVLADPQDRFDEIIRIISHLDVDYSSDREAFRGLVNARRLIDLFPDPQMIRQIYEAAHLRDPDKPMLLQQEAIFEMNAPGGSMDKAANLLQRALAIAPYSKPIKHSLSVLAQKRADRSGTELEKQKYRAESKSLALDLLDERTESAHPYHTLVSVGIDELAELIDGGDEPAIERKIKEIERTLARALQLFPEETYLLDADARLNDLLNRSEKALNALERAFAISKRSTYIASRLSNYYEESGDFDRAAQVLRECLDSNPADKTINFRLAMLLFKSPDAPQAEIGHHLRRSFTEGDSNYAAQFWYARWLYLSGEWDDARQLFTKLSKADIDIRIRQTPRGTMQAEGEPAEFSGLISKLETSYGFIIRDEYQDTIFTHRKFSEEDAWLSLSAEMRVRFNVAFNYRGPVALSVRPEQEAAGS